MRPAFAVPDPSWPPKWTALRTRLRVFISGDIVLGFLPPSQFQVPTSFPTLVLLHGSPRVSPRAAFVPRADPSATVLKRVTQRNRRDFAKETKGMEAALEVVVRECRGQRLLNSLSLGRGGSERMSLAVAHAASAFGRGDRRRASHGGAQPQISHRCLHASFIPQAS